jgi:hypothetical protein
MWGAFNRSFCFKLVLAAAFVVLIAAVRLPFITNILAGEEGDFVALVLNDVPTSALDPDHLPREISGSIDGKLILSTFHRTVMPYIILERLGRLLAPRHALGRMPPEQLTVAGRLPFAIIFLLGSAGLIALTIQAATSAGERACAVVTIAPLGVTFWSLTTPLAVGASIQPQVDGSAGVLLLGTAATLLAIGDIAQYGARWRFLAAGVLAGLGKHEWAMAFAAAAALGAAMISMVATPARRTTNVAFAAFFIGLTLAVALSYAISPEDYRQGFEVMANFFSKTGGQLWALEPAQWPFTLPVVALVVVDGVFLLLVLRPALCTAPGLLLAYLGATGITIGYTISGWHGDNFPRYFAPPVVILPIVFVALWLRFKVSIAPMIGWTVIAATALGLGANSAALAESYASKVSLTELRGTPLAQLAQDVAAAANLARQTHGVVITETTTWIYHPNINYIWATKSYAERYLAAHFPAFKDRVVLPPSSP